MTDHSKRVENTRKHNLFEIITKELVTCEASELYLFAGKDLVASVETPAIRAAIDEAKAAFNCSPQGILAAHYQMGPFSSDVMFEDGARGVLAHNNVAVQFEIKSLSVKSRIYRILFQRIDAEQLLTEVKEKLNDLNYRVTTLERRPGWDRNR
jgi:hypothetical protein